MFVEYNSESKAKNTAIIATIEASEHMLVALGASAHSSQHSL